MLHFILHLIYRRCLRRLYSQIKIFRFLISKDYSAIVVRRFLLLRYFPEIPYLMYPARKIPDFILIFLIQPDLLRIVLIYGLHVLIQFQIMTIIFRNRTIYPEIVLNRKINYWNISLPVRKNSISIDSSAGSTSAVTETLPFINGHLGDITV